MTTFLGLLRDLIAAVVVVLLLFGITITEQQVAAIVQLLAVLLALGTWILPRFQAWRQRSRA